MGINQTVSARLTYLLMSLPWFLKGKGKDREAKDKQLNGHRFATGSCLGAPQCVVCDKPASGKDLLHCPGGFKFNIVFPPHVASFFNDLRLYRLHCHCP